MSLVPISAQFPTLVGAGPMRACILFNSGCGRGGVQREVNQQMCAEVVMLKPATALAFLKVAMSGPLATLGMELAQTTRIAPSGQW